MVRQAQRSAAVEVTEVMTNSFWPWRLLTLLAPKLFGSPVDGDFWGYATYWEDALYIGLLALVLALAMIFRKGKSPQNRKLVMFLIAVISVSLLMGLGAIAPGR